MNTTMTENETIESTPLKPGTTLANIREQKGLSRDYVASKLHLRVRVIELLEENEYHKMPEPVFIKGYLRAYAKLLDISPEPLIEIYNGLNTTERKLDKALWQSRRESNRVEYAVRWMTGIFAFGVIMAVAFWWHANKDNERIFPAPISHSKSSNNKSETEIRLTDLSKMRSLLSSKNQYSTLESTSE